VRNEVTGQPSSALLGRCWDPSGRRSGCCSPCPTRSWVVSLNCR